MKSVFLVSHLHVLPRGGEEDVKIIGIYSDLESARLAVRRAKRREGFCDHPTGFVIDRYELGKDEWKDGFATVIYRVKKRRSSRHSQRSPSVLERV